MPGLSWSSLQVVAADGLVGDRGVALRTPILKDEEGRLFLPAGVEDETVVPRQRLSVDEVRDLLDGGAWIPIQPREAIRGHVVVLRAAPFAGACRMVGLGDGLRWEDHHGRIDIAYVARSEASAWRASCAERLVHRSETAIGQHLGAFWYPPSLATAQTLLEMAMFVTNAGTPTRHRIFVLLGVIGAERPLASGPMLETTALFESPGLDRAQLGREIEAARDELKIRAERHSPKSWTMGLTVWRQPAVLC
jgi:hypothetical protein